MLYDYRLKKASFNLLILLYGSCMLTSTVGNFVTELLSISRAPICSYELDLSSLDERRKKGDSKELSS